MSSPPVQPPDARPPQAQPGPVQPRASSPDSFEQNPLSNVAERISIKASEGLNDEGRVREALRIVIAEGLSINEAARRCQVAPSFLAMWREKYLHLLNEEQSVAAGPLMDEGATVKDADLITIPQAAREQFTENWERLVLITEATPSTFQQNPVQVFLENSWITSWLFSEGQLDRGVVAGAAVALLVLILTGSFLFAGHFYRPPEKTVVAPLNYDENIREAAAQVGRFFNAATAEEKLKYVRLNDGARPGFDAYFVNNPAVSVPDARLSKAIPTDKFILLELDIPSLNRTHQCIVVHQDGGMLVDWETSSWFQEANLQELRRTQSRTPVRVATRVILDSYYNFGFTEKDYTCFRLTYPGLPLDFYAYTQRGAPEDAALRTLLEPLTGVELQISAILEVKYPQGSDIGPNQVQIVRLVSKEWVSK
jgi:hypothetical protein